VPSDEELRAIAERRVDERIGFYIHLTAYVAVNIGLFLTWFYTTQGFPWFVFVLAFWGVGIVAHGIAVFASQGYFDRKVEKEFQKLKNQRH
jgi:small-conductance mechanosensitive channel